MCGLTLSIHPYPPTEELSNLLESLCEACAARGPDIQSTYRNVITTNGGDQIEIVLCASVLGLRGGVVQQPIVGKRGVLGWNGQVFDGLDIGQGNDTAALAERLEAGAEPMELLGTVEGPYAFVYLDLEESKVYFQLDPLSRRSLLTTHPLSDGEAGTGDAGYAANIKNGGLLLSSVRSPLGRTSGLEMRALGGGEGGIIDLRSIGLNRSSSSKTLEFDKAMQTWLSRSGGRFTHLEAVNISLPSDEPGRSSSEDVNAFIEHLTRSIRRRVDNVPPLPSGRSRVAVLFSGGVDCTLLAGLLHRCLSDDEPVDLINVAFSPQGSSTFQTPDRLSGIEAWNELQEACPREWRLVTINVSFEECQTQRQAVLDLMYPSSTEMDLSLAFPLYFASRGTGQLHDTSEAYQVKAKVYLSGLGADEQLGGYARHRHAFKMNGWQGLIDETQMDISRLPTRNLSRDDRIISSHARDARYPYLDLTFVSYLCSLPIWTKCNHAFGEGHGDKMLLRMATQHIGLGISAGRVKRAMQFGTRSSKMSVSKGPKAGERRVGEANP